MTTLITLNIPVGGDAGPFNLYSNTDGYTTPFATNISAAVLEAGYTSTVVPNGTTIIRVLSTGVCTNYIDIPINLITTTTTTSSSSTSTTTSTSTTAVPTTTTTSSSTSSTTTTSSTSSTSTTTSTTTTPPTTTTTSSSSSTSTTTTTNTTAPVYTYAGTVVNNTANTITANTALIRVNGTPVAFVTLNIAPGATQTFSTTYSTPVMGIGNNFTIELYTYTGVTTSNTMNQVGGDCVTSTGNFVNMGSYLMATSTTTSPPTCSVLVIAMTIS